MTAPFQHKTLSLANSVQSLGRDEHKGERVEKLCRNCISGEEAEIKWFAGLVWKIGKNAVEEPKPSVETIAKAVADILTKDGRPVNWKTVRNWLNEDHAPHWRYVMKIFALAGAESIFDLLDPEKAA